MGNDEMLRRATGIVEALNTLGVPNWAGKALAPKAGVVIRWPRYVAL